jgi:hypothetical protein
MKKVQEKLSKVADLAESVAAKAAMEHIPNHPFPAGTLVKGLVNVLIIGVVGLRSYPIFCVVCLRRLQRIPEVKRKAFDFAMDVVEDVNRMVVAFGKGSASEDLLVESWGDLKAMRYVRPFFSSSYY